nr:class I SAM-dependent methyltransferase [bacterium]
MSKQEQLIWEERVYERTTPSVRAPGLVRQTTKGWFIARFLRPQSHERVLDVGCGLGEFSMLCAAGAREVLGVDASPTAVAAARCAANELGVANATFVEGDVYELAKIAGEPGSFDKILCFDLLEHLSDPESVLQQIHALLRPGGRALAYTNCFGKFSARYLREWLDTGGHVGDLWGIDRRDHHLVRFTP